jgi:hypothetical protein
MMKGVQSCTTQFASCMKILSKSSSMYAHGLGLFKNMLYLHLANWHPITAWLTGKVSENNQKPKTSRECHLI